MAVGKRGATAREKAVVYGVCAMAISLLHTFFVSFFVDLFVRRQVMSGKDEPGPAAAGAPHMYFGSFVVGQGIYAVWNSVNDLGFGWWGDTRFALLGRRRLSRIAFGGPLLATVFCAMWLPWPAFIPPFVHFTVSLVAYDGFFSFTTVAFRALLTDITTSPREREQCNAFAAIGHVVGSMGVGIASFLYEDAAARGDSGLVMFRMLAALVAVASAMCFSIVSSERYTEAALSPHGGQWRTTKGEGAQAAGGASEGPVGQPGAAAIAPSRSSNSSSGGATESKGPNLFAHLRGWLRQPNLLVAVVVWAAQEYACTFATNFFSLFLVVVAGDVFSPMWRSVLVQVSFIVPHLSTLALTPLLPTVGLRSIVRALFGLRFFLCACTWLLYRAYFANDDFSAAIPRRGATLFALVLLGNRVLTEAVCRLQPLILSDLVDEDTMRHERPASMAAAINGLTALVSRPSQSLAPVITYAFLSMRTAPFRHLGDRQSSPTSSPLSPSPSAAAPSTLGDRATAASVVWLLAVTGMATSGGMLLVWQRYDLYGTRLALVRRYMQKRSDAGATTL